jgi:hypothetical protein
MAATQHPTLPAELWLRVLQNIQKEEDLPDLWTSCRHVCTTFKQAVEAIMRENHLRKTWIRFSLGMNTQSSNREDTLTSGPGTLYDEDIETNMVLSLTFEFSHLSEDKTRATFTKIDGSDVQYTESKLYEREIRERLQKAVEGRFIECPHNDIVVRREVSDGPIPGLSVDYENLQLTCDWREMYTVFFGELQIFHAHLNKWVGAQQQWVAGIKEKLERGELDMKNMMEQALHGFASGSENARKIARRARIRKEYMSLDGTEWDANRNIDEEQEEKSLTTLSESRFWSSAHTFSDDEDDDGDDKAVEDLSSDDHEDDEWEDEDGSDMDEE